MATETQSTNKQCFHETDASDSDLLARFLRDNDPTAFEAIVVRHQAMVMGVCRRVLWNVDDREDAFQATFFVLARDARRIRKSRSLASWLYGVAYRTAIKAAHHRVGLRECPWEKMMAPTDEPLELIARRHEHQAVDEELNDLPEKYRTPLVLRYLAGQSNGEIATQLGLTVAAVESRLKRGKRRLRVRLAGRGIGVSVVLGVIAHSQQTASATELLIHQTVEQAVVFQSGAVGGGGSAVQLAREMEITKMAFLGNKALVTSVALTVCLSVGIAVIAAQVGQPGQANGSSNDDVLVLADSPPDVESQDPASAVEATVEVSPGAATFKATLKIDAASAANGAKTRSTVQAIEAKLQQTSSLQFLETPLIDVVEFVQEQLQVPVRMDRRALDDVEIGTDTPVTFNMAAVSYRTSLRLLLRDLGLAYTIEDEVLTITSEDEAASSLEPRIYRIEFERKTTDDIVELITKMVAPDSWEEAGGPGSIMMFNGRLVISQSQYVHEKIAELLTKLEQE